jgi:hypothetical protein
MGFPEDERPSPPQGALASPLLCAEMRAKCRPDIEHEEK